MKSIWLLVGVMIVALSMAQLPVFHSTEFGKQIVIDGREVAGLDSARMAIDKLTWPAEEKNVSRYWVGFAESNTHYIYFFYRKPRESSRTDKSTFTRGAEYMVKVDRVTLKAGPVVRRQ